MERSRTQAGNRHIAEADLQRLAGSRNDKLGLNGRFWIEAAENARHAVPDEVMVVCVGGRLVTEAAATAASVDADHTRRDRKSVV